MFCYTYTDSLTCKTFERKGKREIDVAYYTVCVACGQWPKAHGSARDKHLRKRGSNTSSMFSCLFDLLEMSVVVIMLIPYQRQHG